MRVIVLDHVFDGRAPEPHLFELLNFAFRGRHRVLIQRGPSFDRWRASLSEDARERYDEALRASNELETREPSDHEIRIGTDAGCLSVDDAVERLGRPFLLFVENDRSDRAFIEAVASPPYRDRLRRMHQAGWLAFRSRGGISQIPALLDDELGEFSEDARRMFAVFDSDAPAPGEPSKDARNVAASCVKHRVSHRMLGRRAIENYLTRRSLEAWADGQSQVDTLRGRIETLYGEWFSERPERRHHFFMKRGFKGMSPLHRIYGAVPNDVDRRLKEGFGSDVHDAFTPGMLSEVDLRAEGAWDELSEMIEALVRSMR